MTSNSVAALLDQIQSNPDDLDFAQVMTTIAENYDYQPSRFTNGVEGDMQVNEAGTNEGSCKIFAFAKLNQLSQAQTLACFGTYYRDDVLQNPEGSDHGNIRTFMRHGWEGIVFDQSPLLAR